jgi:hypothetical protein
LIPAQMTTTAISAKAMPPRYAMRSALP